MPRHDPRPSRPSRRQLMKTLAGLGVGSTVFQRAVVAQAPKEGAVTEEMIKQAEWISGIKLADDDRKAIVGRINGASATVRAAAEGDRAERRAARVRLRPGRGHGEPGPRGTVNADLAAPSRRSPTPTTTSRSCPLTALSQLVRTQGDLVRRADEALPGAAEEVRPGAASASSRSPRTWRSSRRRRPTRRSPRASTAARCTASRGGRRT